MQPTPTRPDGRVNGYERPTDTEDRGVEALLCDAINELELVAHLFADQPAEPFPLGFTRECAAGLASILTRHTRALMAVRAVLPHGAMALETGTTDAGNAVEREPF